MAAGQGFKTFTSGEVLTAADVNGYLMQGVGVFADATERDAEITSPQEGQFAYLKDTNVTTYYTGSTWANFETSYTWATYTPTNSGITVGNGTQVARFVKVGKTVFVSYKFTLGSTSSLSGGISVGLPSTNNSIATCSVIIQDTGTANYYATGWSDPSTSLLLIRPVKTSTTYGELNDNLSSMFSWTTNDYFQFFVTYEEA